MTETNKQGMSIKSGVSTCYYSVFKHWQNWTIIRLQKCPNHSNSSEDTPPSTSSISVKHSKQSTRSHISWPAWFLTVIVLCGYYFYTLQTGKQLKKTITKRSSFWCCTHGLTGLIADLCSVPEQAWSTKGPLCNLIPEGSAADILSLDTRERPDSILCWVRAVQVAQCRPAQ